MDFDDNQKLINSLISGEEKAYIYLLEKYHRQLNAYALTLTHEQAVAQDIVQNVFLKTWRSRKKLNPQFSIRNFLYKCVYNEFLNHYQKNKAVVLLNEKYIEYTHEVAEEIDDNIIEKMMDIVNKEIQKLPPKCQRVFILSKKEGLTNNEISDYLNISIKTVEAQITKAFSILKTKLGEKYETILFMVFGYNIGKLKGGSLHR
ncbi:RNA polymerase sigma-70 factor [Maribacter polysiphoniae]|uniref:RNA polymerase sigma-70 factor n=1 Tax=Maribacter polysiphoniae TaxID=429344 RepID=A0A316DZ62_9FLAO|nr:RNA polymerase sigma-70 factor [Maribacter polysiphoniae]MBD1262132.1 RNA polymerase sigma-70 factor [Maribacter polysiphoniae]PWK21823.1 RNA polymerase sigma-70 factor (ECF subfamily) [Maribacter polysiphoniae]